MTDLGTFRNQFFRFLVHTSQEFPLHSRDTFVETTGRLWLSCLTCTSMALFSLKSSQIHGYFSSRIGRSLLTMSLRFAIVFSPFHSLRDRLKYGRLATQSADAVLAQNAVGDVFYSSHNSNPRVLTPFNEIRLAFHCFTYFLLSALPNTSLQEQQQCQPAVAAIEHGCTD